MKKLIRSCISLFDICRDDISDELQIVTGAILIFASFAAAAFGSVAYFKTGDIGAITYVLLLVPLASAVLFPLALCAGWISKIIISFATNGEYVLSDEYLVEYIFGINIIYDDNEIFEICAGIILLGWIFTLTVLMCIELPVLAIILGLFVGGLYLSRFIFRVKGKLNGHVVDPNAHSNQKGE